MTTKKTLAFPLIITLIITLQGCSNQAFNYIEKQHYNNLWVWHLNIARVDTSFIPYQTAKDKNTWQNGEAFKTDFSKQTSDHVFERFLALGFDGEIKIRILRLLATKEYIDKDVKYALYADIHFSIDSPDLVLEELWNLKTSYQAKMLLSNKNEKLLTNKMLNNLVYQLHNFTGIKLQKKLEPLIIKDK